MAKKAAEPKKITGTMSEAIRQALSKLGPEASAKDVGVALEKEFPDDKELELKIANDSIWSATVSGQRSKVRESLGMSPAATGTRKAQPQIVEQTLIGNNVSVLQKWVEDGLDLKAIQDAMKEVDRFNGQSGKKAITLELIAVTVKMAQSQFEELKRQQATLEKFFG